MFQNFTQVPTAGSPEKFKIIWHVGSAIESIADTPPNQKHILDAIRSRVDGYYFLVLNNGSLLTYWKDRPIQCLINFKNLRWKNEDGAGNAQIYLNGESFDKDTQAECSAALLKYQENLWNLSGKKLPFKKFQVALHEDALKRVLANLDIKAEQAAGKKVMAEMILRTGNTGDFNYDPNTDKVQLVVRDGQLSLPKSYDFLRSNGIIANRLMTYQEPRPQSDVGALLRVPLVKGGPTVYPAPGGCSFCLPKNLRVLDLVANALQRENLETPRLAINIRTWDSTYEEAVKKQLASRPSKFDGINVEGNAKKLDKKSYESSIKGVKWMIQNTNLPISFLIPGVLFDGETDREEVRDEKYLENFLTYVNELNADLNNALALPPGKNALCNSRLSLIVGSYGAPVHMQTLPLVRRDRNGVKTNRAGTVSTEIIALSNLRTRLCN